ncbi:hypothetical protein [Argonema antarcticum]|nr:hypothetical protein [Argonema antarcticum]
MILDFVLFVNFFTGLALRVQAVSCQLSVVKIKISRAIIGNF